MYSGRAKLVNKVIKSASNRASEFYRRVFGEKSVAGLTKVESLMTEVLDVLLEEFFLESNFSKSAGQVQRSNSLDPVVFAIRKSRVFCLGVDVVFLAKSVDVLSPNSRLVDRVSFSSWHRSSSLNAFQRRLSFFVISWSATGDKVDHLGNSLLDSRFFSHFLLVAWLIVVLKLCDCNPSMLRLYTNAKWEWRVAPSCAQQLRQLHITAPQGGKSPLFQATRVNLKSTGLIAPSRPA